MINPQIVKKSYKNDRVKVSIPCFCCGKEIEIGEFNADVFDLAFSKYFYNGVYAIDAFDFLSKEKVEMFISGTCDDCFPSTIKEVAFEPPFEIEKSKAIELAEYMDFYYAQMEVLNVVADEGYICCYPKKVQRRIVEDIAKLVCHKMQVSDMGRAEAVDKAIEEFFEEEDE